MRTGTRLLVVAVCSAAVALTAGGAATGQHPGGGNHLLGTGAFGAFELVSKLDLTDTPDLIADVAVDPRGTYAYLANWGEPDCAANAETGGQNSPDAGAWVIDISDLRNPRQVGFIPHHQDSRPGEGMQVFELTTKQFSGQVLVMNNEQCGKNGKGGVSLFDVTNPLKPYKLSEHFGDRGTADSHEIHSAFAWDAGDKAYVVIVDNLEFPDVDILDITNPKRPRLIAEYDLNDFGVDQPELGLTETLIHDMVVKQIGGRFIMLVSYWDGGFVKLDVTDPANAVYLADTEYNDPDPELLESTGIALPPEGNGHQAEFTLDNRFFIGTDEDFGPYSVGEFEIATGPNAGVYPSVGVGGAAPVTILPDQRLNGPTVYVGYACPGTSAPVPPRSSVALPPLAAGEEAIAVVQRGPSGDPSAPEDACFPGEKAANAIAAGYDAVVFVQRHLGSAAADDDPPFCGSGAFPATPRIVGVCTTHEAFHRLFDTTPNYALPYPPEPNTEPDLGTVGHKVDVDSVFDGWGYVHLFDAATMQELDTYAIDEAHDPDFAVGFGDLTVHEVATDPQNASRAYLSYYSGGMRAIDIQCASPTDPTTCELVEVGGYLDPNGNDFWGVEAFVRDGTTYVLGSDLDSGLWIFRRG